MKILFQGSLGAYSHLAALEVYPEAEIIPCKTFDDCFSKANEDDKIKIIIFTNISIYLFTTSS